MLNQDFLVFTNGVDIVKRYNGTDVVNLSNLPSSGNTICKALGLLENHLLLFHTIEGGTTLPQRVRRSDTGDPAEWVTGNAGFDDLLDSEDFIVTAEPFGPYVIIYRERSINRMSFVGTSDRLFNFETTITGEGVISLDSVINLGDIHIIFGNTNFYEYTGGFSLRPVGDELFDLVFGQSGELNPSNKNRSLSIYVEELDEAWFFYPTGQSDSPDRVVRYNVSKRSWVIKRLTDKIVGFGFYQKDASLTWNDLEGSWIEQTFAWNSKQLLANAPTIQFCGESPLQVYEYDFVSVTDDGTDITYSLETKDFFDAHKDLR
ncbi:hypothetical protein LCGC14_2946880, partial [marine sediment metagenome]